jgi:DNA-binding response OmpR family regulator
MIQNEKQYKTTLERISQFQKQVEHLRKVETNPENYHLSVSGFLAELDRMNMDVREYLWSHPGQVVEDRRTA